MSRAHTTALTLVNWKGVFFERYVLDRHVTALEGANGAGKTTVMVAAYLVLLPDLTRLKFTNLGETGATGGDRGIYGRLGDPGPSYAALDIERGDGHRVVAGVYIERKTAPTLALTPFLLEEGAAPLAIEQLFLRQNEQHEEVRPLRDLAQAVKEAGGNLISFPSSKEYFAQLFERGLLPLRLASDEERNKFNEMLRTSMTGGISRTLTSDLRSFVLEREGGLLDTLGRMRKNLEACRRTRLEVAEARTLEQEIHGIYSAGEAMFGAALDASRNEELEARQALERVEGEWQSACAAARELSTRVRELELAQAGLAPRVERGRETEQALRERLAGLERARRASGRLSEVEAGLGRALPEVEAARQRKLETARERQRTKQERDQAQAARELAAAGLASMQAGLEELHRRAHGFRRARQELERARSAHAALVAGAELLRADDALEPVLELLRWAERLERAEPGAEPAGLPGELLAGAVNGARDLKQRLDRELAVRERRAAATEQRRRDHSEARAALLELAPEAAPDALADAARSVLARLAELESLAARAVELAHEARRVLGLAERRRKLSGELEALGFAPLPSGRGFIARLAELEAAVRGCERAQHERLAAAQQHGERAALVRARRPALEARVQPYRQLQRVESQLRAREEAIPETRAALEARISELEQKRELARDEAARWSRERRTAWDDARALEAAGQGASAELLALAERLEGELLAQRYEDLELEEARRVEAALGPLAQAIVVEDPWQAVSSLLEQPGELESVWLLRSGAAAPTTPQVALAPLAATGEREQPPGHAVVDLGYGLRVTRLPASVSLGRAARARRAEALRALAEECAGRIEASEREQQAWLETRRELELLARHWELRELGDPALEIERGRAEEQTELEAKALAEQAALAQRLEAARLDAQLGALRAHLADHHLLDAPELAQESEQARLLSERARAAATQLERSKAARQTLARLLPALEAPPAAGTEDSDALQSLTQCRDQCFALGDALAALDTVRSAWGWVHAERALSESSAVVPELSAQHATAQRELERSQASFERSELEWESATALAQEQDARLAALEAHQSRARSELEAEAAGDASDAALELARAELVQQSGDLGSLAAQARGMSAELARQVERAEAAQRSAEAAERALVSERARSEPLAQRWAELAEQARAAGVGEQDALSAPDAARAPSSLRWLEARAKCELLADRLSASHGAAALAEQATAAAANPDRASAAHYLQLWLGTRDWLLARLPAPLGGLGEPLLGLGRLRADLGELESRLDRQEGDLRGTSADVARSIDVQVRRAAARVRRLNRALEGISFGGVGAIQVQMERVAKMESVLRALREGETQDLLFQSNLPLEEALDEIFRRHAGGRTGGQRLLDYREYLELGVQIQRRGSTNWERVNPSQVSTGEAIGVGAALMMVILAEWERDDQLLRRERSLGSLRFLFLDEANRLSKDNLAVLFELCRNLDLQLLIAAPEVAHAEGNTTYHLVRRLSAEGLEQVLVTGRRSSLPEPPAPRQSEVVPAPAPAAPKQLALAVD